MARRSSRGSIDNRKVLPRLREDREGAIEVRRSAKINSDECKAADDVLDAINKLAEQLTDDESYFVGPNHSAE